MHEAWIEDRYDLIQSIIRNDIKPTITKHPDGSTTLEYDVVFRSIDKVTIHIDKVGKTSVTFKHDDTWRF